MPKLSAPDPIRYLVNRKYPSTGSALARIIEHVDKLPEPANPLLGLVQDSDFQQGLGLSPEAEDYRRKLASMSKGEIDILYKQELQKQREEEDQKQFFSQPDAEADYDFWSRTAHWTLDEAIALTFGKEPRVVFWERLKGLYTSPFAKKYGELRDLTNRAKLIQKLYDPVFPGIYIGWIDQNEIAFPQELKEKVITRGNHIIDWKKNYEDMKRQYDGLLNQNNANVDKAGELLAKKDEIIGKQDEVIKSAFETIKTLKNNTSGATKPEKSLSTRERETVCKIIVGMAVDGYGYDPKASKTSAAKEISDYLLRRGIPVTDDTIRKWLKEGTEYLPPVTE